ncbi:LPO_1073/Vpar_1526 family protein [Cobetia amphilecti]|uniref:LPO_1073/Vpar_1526 family protein n=1 Tax=Cobetia amphilecti TaxID=1055104 RepID=UPI0012EB11EF|nr:LPO_1073/Vpar_1526 family protein [Cobetia amphilecti]
MAAQANGDVNITQNVGMGYSEVKDLCTMMLRENFPKLREEAIKAAEENVYKFSVELEDRIVQRSNDFVIDKLATPELQAVINDSVQAAARKGDKANTSILVDLITEIGSSKSSDYKDLVISEAITVTPKLTRPQISYLALIFFTSSVAIGEISDIGHVEAVSSKVWSLVNSGVILSDSQRYHIQYTGACNISAMMSNDIYGKWYKGMCKDLAYENVDQMKEVIASRAPNTYNILSAYDKDNQKGNVVLTSVGQAIAIAHLSTVLGSLDYSVWIN